MKNNIHIATVLAFGLMAVSTQESVAAPQIDNSTITATTRGVFHTTTAPGMVNPARQVGQQFKAPRWNATPFPDFFAFAECVDGWIMFDLGVEYNLEEIRLWNANLSHSDNGLMGWHVKNLSIHVAGTGAVMPLMTAGGGNYFTDPSWTSVFDGDLAQGPGGTGLAQDQLVGPQLTHDVTGNNGVRYIAIDVDSRVDAAAAVGLIGYIQVDGELPPTPGTLIYGK